MLLWFQVQLPFRAAAGRFPAGSSATTLVTGSTTRSVSRTSSA